jgi:D-beta-D-heptose 7-phosphate kinase/D-beta-D-heptose 1-phosphate adenosyltransferase
MRSPHDLDTKAPRLLVFGDAMLDRSVFGVSDRECPEARSPVLRPERTEDRPGGAASVAAVAAALGATVDLVALVGDDEEATRLRRLLQQMGVAVDGLRVDPQRRTTLKSRFFAEDPRRGPRLLLRVDREDDHALAGHVEDELRGYLDRALGACDAVLVSDYAKGVCTPGLLGHVIGYGRAAGKPVLVDPSRAADYAHYRGASGLTPNRREAELATGLSIADPAGAMRAGRRLVRELRLDAAAVTLDTQGAVVVTSDGRAGVFPARPSRVQDPTGAGDTVLAVLGLGLATGLPLCRATELAVIGGGLQVERVGVVPVSWEQILREDAARHPEASRVHAAV